jgi:prophage antirepressor-like protein
MSNDDESDVLRVSPFEAIRKQAEDGSEYWNARDLAKIVGYTQYNKFTNAIQKRQPSLFEKEE